MDDFWRQNFLSVLKLRKKKEGIPYFTVFEKNYTMKSIKEIAGQQLNNLQKLFQKSEDKPREVYPERLATTPCYCKHSKDKKVFSDITYRLL